MERILLLVAVIIAVAAAASKTKSRGGNETKQPINKSQHKDDGQAMLAYTNACHKLQGMADWMTLAFRVKGLFSRSASQRKQARLLQQNMDAQKDAVATEAVTNGDVKVRKKRNADSKASCASLTSLSSSAQTYVQWQTELMKAKALLGGNYVRSGVTRLNDTNFLKNFRDVVQPLTSTNDSSNVLLQSLKLGSQVLAQQLEVEKARALDIIRGAGKSDNFMDYLRSARNSIIGGVNSLVQTSEGLRKAQDFLQRGDLLKVLNNALDRTTSNSSVASPAKGDLPPDSSNESGSATDNNQ